MPKATMQVFRTPSIPPVSDQELQERLELARLLSRLSRDFRVAADEGNKLQKVVEKLHPHQLSEEALHQLGRCANKLVELLDAAQSNLLGVAEVADVTSQKMANLQDRAVHDQVTSVYNRGTFEEYLPLAVEHAHREELSMSLLMLDIDHFKAVNDTHGHIAGDLVLKEVARQLKAGVREGDEVFRVGGDEFAIAIHARPSIVAEIAERLGQGIHRQPIRLNNHVIRVTVSVGVAHLQPMENRTGLYARADNAMYRAKKAGRNKLCISPGLCL